MLVVLIQESEASEKLRVEKSSLEVRNEKLKLELEETKQKLLLSQSKGPSMDGADSKTWKSKVVTRYHRAVFIYLFLSTITSMTTREKKNE